MYVFLTLFLVIQLVHGATRQDAIATCSNAGSTCFGYDSDGDCSSDVSKCEFGFASVSKNANNGYKVYLVGKGGGWVSLGFSDDEEAMMRENNLGIVCVNAVEPPIQILTLQDIPAKPGKEKKPFVFDNSGLAEGISNGKLELHDGWMICEFDLNSKISHAGKSFDLKKNPYKLGLAVNPEQTLHEPDSEYGNVPYYHGGTRGASEKKSDIFQKL